jgi:hypothetical protein
LIQESELLLFSSIAKLKKENDISWILKYSGQAEIFVRGLECQKSEE